MDLTVDYRGLIEVVAGPGAAISVGSGRLWLTRDGDMSDYVVDQGQTASLCEGRWLIQALAPSRFECKDGLCREVSHEESRLHPVSWLRDPGPGRASPSLRRG